MKMINKVMKYLLFANYCLANKWATKKRINESTIFLFSTEVCYILSGIYFSAIGYFTIGVPRIVINSGIIVIAYLSFYWKKKYLEEMVTSPEMRRIYLSTQPEKRNKISLYSFFLLLSGSIFFIVVTIIFFRNYFNRS